jgi:hypothetical protein
MAQNGKGDAPRNCFSQEFRDNHDSIDWRKKPVAEPEEKDGKKQGRQTAKSIP